MPLVKILTSANVDPERRESLCASICRAVTEVTGKPERYTMVTVETGCVLLGGKAGLGAFVDVRSIGGLTADSNQKLSDRICRTLREVLAVPPDRVYINFIEIAGANWGHNGSTFG